MMDDPIQIASEIRAILREYYLADHRFVRSFDLVIAADPSNAKEVSLAIGQIGWSGMGSFVDQVFCDLGIPHSVHVEDSLKVCSLMYKLGSCALAGDPETPNHQGIGSMLSIWEQSTHIITD